VRLRMGVRVYVCLCVSDVLTQASPLVFHHAWLCVYVCVYMSVHVRDCLCVCL